MRLRRLQTRFVLAGSLLVVLTIACGLWSAIAFARLEAKVGRTLRESESAIKEAAALTNALEREDDALANALGGEVKPAREEVLDQRRLFDEAWKRLEPLLDDDDELAVAQSLQESVATYRKAGDRVLARAGKPGARKLYKDEAKPARSAAVAECGKLRELSFRDMRRTGVSARDVAARATWIVGALSLGAVLLSVLVSVRLARSVVGPVRRLTDSLEAVTRGNFDQRLPAAEPDELGVLARGFNQMAEALAEYRSSSLGELLQAKTTLEATLAAMPDAVLVADPDGNLVSVNPAARALLEAAGRGDARTLEDLPLTPEGIRTVRETVEKQAAPGNRSDWTRVLPVAVRGRLARFTLGVAPVPDYWPGRPGVVVVLADVSDFVRIDELRSELVAVASHELKTPLTALRMNLLLLQEELPHLPPRQEEILTAALTGAEELGGTIDELLDLTRIEAGQLRLDWERVDLTAVAGQALRQLLPRFDDKGITLRLEAEAPSPLPLSPSAGERGRGEGAVVRGDPARLRIVLVNLLSNALKYTPPGGQVTVSVASLQNAGSTPEKVVQVAVTDSGPGVPEEFRDKIFEKFFRVEHHRPGTGEGVRGVGIGLYLCKQIVEAHHGHITCTQPEDGRGTRVAVELPAEAARPVHRVAEVEHQFR